MEEILDESQKRGMIQWNEKKKEYEPGPTWGEYAGTVARETGGRRGGQGVLTKEQRRQLFKERQQAVLDDLGLEHDSGWCSKYGQGILNEDVAHVRHKTGLPPMPSELYTGRNDSRDVTDMLRALRMIETHGRVLTSGELTKLAGASGVKADR